MNGIGNNETRFLPFHRNFGIYFNAKTIIKKHLPILLTVMLPSDLGQNRSTSGKRLCSCPISAECFINPPKDHSFYYPKSYFKYFTLG